jgi:capsular exopolysaccharide synthesis family protein
MAMNGKNEMRTPRDFCWVLFRHKGLILFTVLAAVAAATAYAYLSTETYEARAALLVKVGRENVSIPAVPASTQEQVVASLGLRKEDIRSEIELLTNRSLLAQVASEIGVDRLFPQPPTPSTRIATVKHEIKRGLRNAKQQLADVLERIELHRQLPQEEKAVLAISKRLDVEQIRNADVIEVRFRWSDPKVAQQVVQVLLDRYLEHHLQSHKTSGGYEFFRTQAQLLDKRLRDSERQLAELKQSSGVVSYEQQKQALLTQIDTFTAALKQTESELAEAKAEIDELAAQLSSLVTRMTTGVNETVSEARSALMRQQVRRKALESKSGTLQDHIDSYRRELAQLDAQDLEIKRLNRQVAIEEQNYLLYQEKLEEARISDVLDAARIVNVRVIDPPAASFLPVGPNRLSAIVFAAVGGLLAAALLAFVLEYFDRSIKKPEHVEEYLGLPLLASISRRRRAHLEEYECIRGRLGTFTNGSPLKVIMVCGPAGREGVSTVARNLGIALTRGGKARVVLVDANVRAPALHKALRDGNHKGLSDATLNGVDVRKFVVETSVENLYFLPAGLRAEDSLGVLQSKRLAACIERLKTAFDYVILDVAPVNKYPDAGILSRLADGVILVVDFAHTRRETAQLAEQTLTQNSANIVAAVLNRRKYVIPDFVYKRT